MLCVYTGNKMVTVAWTKVTSKKNQNKVNASKHSQERHTKIKRNNKRSHDRSDSENEDHSEEEVIVTKSKQRRMKSADRGPIDTFSGKEIEKQLRRQEERKAPIRPRHTNKHQENDVRGNSNQTSSSSSKSANQMHRGNGNQTSSSSSKSANQMHRNSNNQTSSSSSQNASQVHITTDTQRQFPQKEADEQNSTDASLDDTPEPNGGYCRRIVVLGRCRLQQRYCKYNHDLTKMTWEEGNDIVSGTDKLKLMDNEVRFVKKWDDAAVERKRQMIITQPRRTTQTRALGKEEPNLAEEIKRQLSHIGTVIAEQHSKLASSIMALNSAVKDLQKSRNTQQNTTTKVPQQLTIAIPATDSTGLQPRKLTDSLSLSPVFSPSSVTAEASFTAEEHAISITEDMGEATALALANQQNTEDLGGNEEDYPPLTQTESYKTALTKNQSKN
jgi:hypothetical protein